jgi:transcriptional regulator with XRE-family HTH domain
MKHYELGIYLYNARIKKKLTQEELGEQLGINGKSVSKWERGVSVPSYKVLRKLCEIIGISSDEVLKLI